MRKMIRLEAGTQWVYAGVANSLQGDKSCGRRHTVTSVSKQEDCVTTWSDPTGPKGGGDSWMGSISQFLDQFRHFQKQ